MDFVTLAELVAAFSLLYKHERCVNKKVKSVSTPKIWNDWFILYFSFQTFLYYIPNQQTNCISELSASIEHASLMCKRHISSFSPFLNYVFRYFSWIVIACLMEYVNVWDLSSTLLWVQGSNRDGCTHTRRHRSQEEHRRGKYLSSFYLFCNQINVFLLSLEMATDPCKEKRPSN